MRKQLGKLRRVSWIRNAVRRLRLKRVCFSHRLKHIHPTCLFHGKQQYLSPDLTAHEYVYIGPNCHIGPFVELHAYTMLGPCVSIVGGDHNYTTAGTPMVFAGHGTTEKTVIERDVWLGYGALINSGVTVGRGAIVAARAVVTKDVPPYEIHAGVPAKKIADRFDQQQREIHDVMLQQPPKAGRLCINRAE